MHIAEMHVWFRQYAQQMGMQNVRAILPEQIDNLINTSTIDIIDEIINRNVGTTNDRIITDNAKLANINALRTLYKVKVVPVGDGKSIAEYKSDAFTFDSVSIGEVLYFVDFSIRYSDNVSRPGEPSIASLRSAYTVALSAYKQKLIAYNLNPTSETESELVAAKSALNSAEGNLKAELDNTKLTRWFPIRVIDDAYLSDVLNDWALSPRMRTPVMVVYSLDTIKEGSTFELYVGENAEAGMTSIASSNHIGEIRCSYIKKPIAVRYLSDVGGINVDSDLPEQLQIPMLKHAVDLYRVSIQGSLFAQQQNDQANSQEIARNNARPVNDGYQS